MVPVPFSDPEKTLLALLKIRSVPEQRTFMSSTGSVPSQSLIESISTKIRELLPRDPDLAQTLAETNLYIASILDTSLAWAYANRSRAQVFYTMRKSAEPEPYFDKAVRLFDEAGLPGEVGRTLVGQMDNLMYLSRYTEALEAAQRARSALDKAHDNGYVSRLEIALGNLYYRLNKYSE